MNSNDKCRHCGQVKSEHMNVTLRCVLGSPEYFEPVESDTPRTDAATKHPDGFDPLVDTDFARTLATDFEIADRDVSIEDMTHRIGTLESALATARAQLAEEKMQSEAFQRMLENNKGIHDSIRSRLAEAERQRDLHHAAWSTANSDRDSLRAQLEAVTKERDEADDMLETAAEVAKRSTLKEKIATLTTALAAAENVLEIASQCLPWAPHRKLAIDALALFRAQQPQGGGKEDNG